jgi:hypothetical protein
MDQMNSRAERHSLIDSIVARVVLDHVGDARLTLRAEGLVETTKDPADARKSLIAATRRDTRSPAR